METENTVKQANSGQEKKQLLPRYFSRAKYLMFIGLFTFAGAAGGYLYYALVGCNTGSCAITSNPYMSIAWGGLLGYLLPDFFVKEKKR